MTQEERKLLLADLCGRIPYNVKVSIDGGRPIVLTIGDLDAEAYNNSLDDSVRIKPYLRPMSSMTEEEKNKLRGMLYFGYTSDDYDNYSHRGIEVKTCLYDDEEKSEYDFEDFELLKDFLLKNHLDYHGLIPMGLALPATEGMYKTK